MDLRSLGFLSWNQTEISGGSTYSAVGSFFMVNQEDF